MNVNNEDEKNLLNNTKEFLIKLTNVTKSFQMGQLKLIIFMKLLPLLKILIKNYL